MRRFKAKWNEDGSGGFLFCLYYSDKIVISWCDEDGKDYDLTLPLNHLTEGWSKLICDALP